MATSASEMSANFALFQLQTQDLSNLWNLSNSTTEPPDIDTSTAYNLPSLLLGSLIAWTFFGNMLVLIAVYRERGLKSMSNYVIASLALADLLLSVLVMPLGLVSLVRGHWGLGLPLCVIYLALDVMLCTASIIHLCAIAVNRYLAVTFPLHFSRERVNSRPRILGTIVPVWLVSIAISVPLFVQGFLDPGSTLQNEGRDCGYFNSTFIIYSSMCSFYVPLAVMIVVDWRAVKKLRGRKTAMEFREVKPRTPIQQVNSNSTTVSCAESPAHESHAANGSQTTTSTPGVRKKSLRITFCTGIKKSSLGYGSTQTEAVITRQRWMTSKREHRAAKTLVVVFVCFIVLWLPFFVVHLLSGVCTSCHPPTELFIAFTWLGYLSSAVNPCIYTCFNLDFRRAFLRIITCDRRPLKTQRLPDTATTHTLRTSLRS